MIGFFSPLISGGKEGLELLVDLGTLLNPNFNTFCLKNAKKCIFFVMVITVFRMKSKTDIGCVLLFRYISNKMSQSSLPQYSSKFNIFFFSSHFPIKDIKWKIRSFKKKLKEELLTVYSKHCGCLWSVAYELSRNSMTFFFPFRNAFYYGGRGAHLTIAVFLNVE